MGEWRLLRHRAGARHAHTCQNGGGGDVVQWNAPVEAGQANHLAGARHVGGPQLLVRVGEVHLSARVIDDVNAAGEVTEYPVDKAEPWLGEVPAQRYDPPGRR